LSLICTFHAITPAHSGNACQCKTEGTGEREATDALRDAGACHVAAQTVGSRAHGGCIHRLRVGKMQALRRVPISGARPVHPFYEAFLYVIISREKKKLNFHTKILRQVQKLSNYAHFS
jgi:hypothetical protein